MDLQMWELWKLMLLAFNKRISHMSPIKYILQNVKVSLNVTLTKMKAKLNKKKLNPKSYVIIHNTSKLSKKICEQSVQKMMRKKIKF